LIETTAGGEGTGMSLKNESDNKEEEPSSYGEGWGKSKENDREI